MLSSLFLFFYIFLWPLILPLICIVSVARAPRADLVKVVVRLVVLIVISTIPLLFQIQNDADHDLPAASLMLYPVAVACLLVTALARAVLMWTKRGKAEA